MAVEFREGLAPISAYQSETTSLAKIAQILYNQNVTDGTSMEGADKFSDGLEPGPMNSSAVLLCKINQLIFNRSL